MSFKATKKDPQKQELDEKEGEKRRKYSVLLGLFVNEFYYASTAGSIELPEIHLTLNLMWNCSK